MKAIPGLFLCLILLFLLGCITEVDRERPVVEEFRLFNAPDNDTWQPPASITFVIRLSDNEALNQYRVEILNNFNKSWRPFQQVFVETLSGTVYEGLLNMSISGDSIQAGPYRATLEVVDMSGNRSAVETISFFIGQKGEQPVFTIGGTQPEQNAEGAIIAQPGDTLQLSGLVTDNNGLTNINLRLLDPENNFAVLSTANRNFTDSTTVFVLDSLSVWPVVPETALPGAYEFAIRATDIDGHRTRIAYLVILQ